MHIQRKWTSYPNFQMDLSYNKSSYPKEINMVLFKPEICLSNIFWYLWLKKQFKSAMLNEKITGNKTIHLSRRSWISACLQWWCYFTLPGEQAMTLLQQKLWKRTPTSDWTLVLECMFPQEVPQSWRKSCETKASWTYQAFLTRCATFMRGKRGMKS